VLLPGIENSGHEKHSLRLEEPNIKKDAVMLPPKVMETIHSIIFSESQQGRKFEEVGTHHFRQHGAHQQAVRFCSLVPQAQEKL